MPLDAAELAMAGRGTCHPGLLSQGEETNTEKINTSGRARTGPLISCGKLGNDCPLPVLRRVGGFDGAGM